VLVLAVGCAAEPAPEEPAAPATGTTTAAPPPSRTPSPTSTPTPEPPPEPVLGVDLSHHQGDVDWPRVAGAGMAFAYLKATEGSTYTDPTFATNADDAAGAGLRVGGYHYFNLCAPGAPQGEHFARVLDDVLAAVPQRRRMPPAVDLEILGSCDTPPARDDLLREVRAFLAAVEPATGQQVVVYAFPEFERTYRFAGAIDRRQWVRRLGDRPPKRDWWLWQKDQAASVDGVSGPVDLNVLRDP
jgi:lysozyme